MSVGRRGAAVGTVFSGYLVLEKTALMGLSEFFLFVFFVFIVDLTDVAG